MACGTRQAGDTQNETPKIEVTPEMIEAGVFAARECCLGSPLADLVRTVYVAMFLEDKGTRVSASSTMADR